LQKKKQSEGVRFCKFGTQNTVPCCQKCTPTDSRLAQLVEHQKVLGSIHDTVHSKYK